MDESNYQNLKKLSDSKLENVMYLRNFDPNYKDLKEVPDPYYGDLKDFYEVHEILSRCTFSFLNYLESKNND